MTRPNSTDRLRQYDRFMLRSAFASLFWSAIVGRRKRGKYTLQSLADGMGIDKSAVSRWFSKNTPNWRIDTIADIAHELDLDLQIEAIERTTRTVYTPQGIQAAATMTDSRSMNGDDTTSAFGAPTSRTDVLRGNGDGSIASVS